MSSMTASASESSARLSDRDGEPLVSVLTATYNSSPYLELTLESALGQGYTR